MKRSKLGRAKKCLPQVAPPWAWNPMMMPPFCFTGMMMPPMNGMMMPPFPMYPPSFWPSAYMNSLQQQQPPATTKDAAAAPASAACVPAAKPVPFAVPGMVPVQVSAPIPATSGGPCATTTTTSQQPPYSSPCEELPAPTANICDQDFASFINSFLDTCSDGMGEEDSFLDLARLDDALLLDDEKDASCSLTTTTTTASKPLGLRLCKSESLLDLLDKELTGGCVRVSS